jgi:hypothetical protein
VGVQGLSCRPGGDGPLLEAVYRSRLRLPRLSQHLRAQSWAATWALSAFHIIDYADLEIRHNFQVTANIAKLEAESRALPAIAVITSTIWHLAGTLTEVTFRQVRASRKDALTPLAKLLCYAVLDDPRILCHVEHPASEWTRLSPPNIRLISVLLTPWHLMDAYPVGTKSGSMQIGNVDGSWRALSAGVLAHGFDADVTATQSRGSRLARGEVIDAAQEDPSLEWLPETINIATSNTLTMRRTGAYIACARQLHEQGIDTRPDHLKASRRPSCVERIAISCFPAPPPWAERMAASFGVCLSSSWATGDKKHWIPSSCVFISDSSPRFLLVRIKTTKVYVDIPVAHGPCQGYYNCVEDVFWADLAGKVNARTAPSLAVILMVDANANLHSITKLTDVNHRAAFVHFLEVTGLREASLADSTGKHHLFVFVVPWRNTK